MLVIIYSLLLSQILNYKNSLIKQKIQLPNLLDVYPEINKLWPIWVKKGGVKVNCKTDDDCLFPQACCHNPIIPGEKFCCNGGYKTRMMKYAFIEQQV